MSPAAAFLDACHAQGCRFITGTPCSYLKPLINAAIDDPRFRFCDAVNEGDAVAMAAGATLAGVRSLVMFQNSGLGNAVNALTSLCHPFRVPVLLVVTHRGEPSGEADEPQHELMGRITTGLLDTMGIAWAGFPEQEPAAAVARAVAHMDMTGRPYALVMRKGTVAPQALQLRPAGLWTDRKVSFRHVAGDPADYPSRAEALQTLRAARLPNEVLIATTGYTGRELCAQGDAPWNLYMIGSMGSASAFGLGLALHAPRHAVTVIEGDGALLMRMGNLATLGAYAPPKLRHVVLDNAAHESTGGQSTVSPGVAFAAIAQACGYDRVFSVDNLADFAAALAVPLTEGPAFIHLRIKPGAPDKLPRPKVAPADVFRRLQHWLGVPELP
ncbi:MAG: phosphonopyruvate decarboxylase [Opitutaceae bacterium]|nr:phosphonopyruvate decarboxylase [Opitutaceae bacterium]